MNRFLIIPLLFLSLSASGQNREKISIYFNKNGASIDSTFMDNHHSINKLDSLVDKIERDSMLKICLVNIECSASPEGGTYKNSELLRERATAMRKYLVEQLDVADSLIYSQLSSRSWDNLRTLVEESDMPYRDEVLNIIDSVPEESWSRKRRDDRWLTLVDSRNKHLMDLRHGVPYIYMDRNIFPLLRSGNVVTIYYDITPMAVASIQPTTHLTSLSCSQLPSQPLYLESRPLFALKTNLLFDAFTLINFEVEVPIKKRWSIAAELIYPWWTWDNGELDSKRHRIQLLNGNLEGRYWFGERENLTVLTGWFAGVYAGGGLYDFEYNKKGYQGEFFVAAGLSGGYSHTINKSKSLRLEYSLGIGYMQTNYRYYQTDCYFYDSWHPVIHSENRYTWLGPTRLKVSLSWLLATK